ncbi:MAG: cytochrome c peroxidase [Betaproteobacteria bacterium]|jgi:cytochrome c peroxidase
MKLHIRVRSFPALSAAALLAALLTGCGGGGGSTDSAARAEIASTPQAPGSAATEAARVAVGDLLFHDTRLSAAGNLACASCHVKERGHADADGVFLPLGGPRLDQQGLRSSPTLNYLNDNRAFAFDGQGSPSGGFTWDGRADTRAAQSLGPLLAPSEMAHADSAAVVARVRTLPYFAQLLSASALDTTASDAQVLQALQGALQSYQAGDVDYQPFTSKFDAVQDGRATFAAQEARGLALFNSPQQGNCASCHSSTPPAGQARALFTNFGYFALGVPRNQSTATADPAFFDMGLCGPVRTDLANRTDLCGQFKVPTLRNVALTAPYYHNGAVATLQDAVSFYATRDIDPARWYPVVNGVVDKFNDLPAAYRGNVNQQPPFGLQPGQPPRLNAQEVQDLVAFLRTLTDGFVP